MDSEEPSCIQKMMQEFRPTHKATPRLHIRGSNVRLSGAFPFSIEPSYFTPVLGENDPSKRPFDETLLNENDYLIKKKRRTSLEELTPSDSSVSETPVLASPWEYNRLKSELVETKATVLTQEARISKLHGLRKEAELVFQKEKTSLNQTIERDRVTISKLEKRIKVLKRREEKLKKDLDKQLVSLAKEKQLLEANRGDILEENLELKKQLSESEEKGSEARRRVSSLEVELAGYKKEIEMTKEQLTATTANLAVLKQSACQAEIDKAALTTAEIKIAELESERKNFAEMSALVNVQHDKLLRYTELERQLANLTQEYSKMRHSMSNSLYLEGIVEDLRRKLSGLTEREKESQELRVELGLAEGKLKEWSSVAECALGPTANTPGSLACYIRQLHLDHLIATSNVSQLQAKLKTLEGAKVINSNEIKQLKENISKLQNELEEAYNSQKRLKIQNTIITLERDSWKNWLDSFKKELAVTGVDMEPRRFEALEKIFESYRKKTEELKQSLEFERQGSSTVDGGASAEAESKIKALTKERDDFKTRMETLELEMEHRTLKGDFNLRDTKILHFKMNPASEAEAKYEDELSACQAEIIKLRERVRLLQEGHSTSNLTQTVEDKVDVALNKQVEELEGKLKSQEVQQQRLKEIFRAKSREFREGIYALLGYKVDLLSNKMYKLSSLYADSPEQHLIFKLSSKGEMELLETEFSTTLAELIELHLCQYHSIPVFLSSVTIDLFQKQTHLSSTTSV